MPNGPADKKVRKRTKYPSLKQIDEWERNHLLSELKELSEYYCKLLLVDYHIEILLTSYDEVTEMAGEVAYGHIRFNTTHRKARMWLIDPAREKNKSCCMDYDIEHSLVHELLELLYAPLKSDPVIANFFHQEQEITLNKIAWALVEQRRKVNHGN